MKCVFPYFSLTMGIHFSHILRILWISGWPEIFKKLIHFKYFCFLILFLYYGNPLFPCFEFWKLYGFVFIAKNVKNIWSWNVLFSHTFPVLSEITFPMCWDNSTDVKTHQKTFFWSHFYTNVYMKLFTEEVNLFYSWGRPNICISDPFAIEAWRYIQCRRVGSVFYGSASTEYSSEYDNRHYKWASAEMYLRRFLTAFRTATIKNTHKWLFPKCLWSSCL